MDFIWKIIVLITGVGGGLALIIYSYQLTQLFGHQEYAERFLGAGGTYSMWKLLGLLAIVGAVWWVI